MTPTVIHLIISLNNGGCENNLLRILPLMRSERHIVVTIKEEGLIYKEFKRRGIETVCLNQNRPVSLGSLYRIISLIKETQPDLVISYLAHADLMARLAQLFVSVRVAPFVRAAPSGRALRMVRIFERLTKHLVSHYLANSQAVKDYYINILGVNPDKITVLPNGVDINIFQQARPERVINELKLEAADPVFICVANLHPDKGHDYLLEAFNQVAGELPNAWLLLAGDGTRKQVLLDQIDRYRSKNRILFLGKRDDVPELLAASTIFVFPSLHEGMSNAVLEAAAAKKPLLLSDIPENHAITDCALFFVPGSVEDLAEKMLLLARDNARCRKLSEAAHAEIREKFDLSKMATTFSQQIKALSGER